MKRLAIPVAAFVAACSIVYAVVAAPLIASNPPLALTPGTDQPLTCSTTLVGTLADPACATVVPPTATATPTSTPTATPAGQFVGNHGLNAGEELRVVCNDGAGPLDRGADQPNGLLILCPTGTPTPNPTTTVRP